MYLYINIHIHMYMCAWMYVFMNVCITNVCLFVCLPVDVGKWWSHPQSTPHLLHFLHILLLLRPPLTPTSPCVLLLLLLWEIRPSENNPTAHECHQETDPVNKSRHDWSGDGVGQVGWGRAGRVGQVGWVRSCESGQAEWVRSRGQVSWGGSGRLGSFGNM